MNSKIAFVLLSALGATAALPAIATMAAEHRGDRLDFSEDRVLRELKDKGVDAASVEEWNGLLRAYVRVNGTEVMQYFDPDTLAPAAL